MAGGVRYRKNTALRTKKGHFSLDMACEFFILLKFCKTRGISFVSGIKNNQRWHTNKSITYYTGITYGRFETYKTPWC